MRSPVVFLAGVGAGLTMLWLREAWRHDEAAQAYEPSAPDECGTELRHPQRVVVGFDVGASSFSPTGIEEKLDDIARHATPSAVRNKQRDEMWERYSLTAGLDLGRFTPFEQIHQSSSWGPDWGTAPTAAALVWAASQVTVAGELLPSAPRPRFFTLAAERADGEGRVMTGDEAAAEVRAAEAAREWENAREA